MKRKHGLLLWIATVTVLACLSIRSAQRFSNQGQSGQSRASLESVWLQAMNSSASQDYERMWYFVSRETKDKVGDQLNRIRSQLAAGGIETSAAQMLLRQMGIRSNDLSGLGPREYFLAMMRGLDSVQPELRAHQINETAGASIVSVDHRGSSAVIHWATASGKKMSDTWVSEDGEWKCHGKVF